MLSCAVLYGILMAIYEYQVEPVITTAEGILFFQIAPVWDVLFFFLGMVPTLWLPTHCNKPSHFSWWILYITVIAPSCIECPHMLTGNLQIWPMLVVLVFFFCLLMQVSNFKPLKLPRISVSPRMFWTLAVVFTIATFVSLAAFYGISREGLSLTTAHALRAAFKEKSKEVPLLVRYLFRWDAEVILPSFVAYGVIRKSFFAIGIGCAGEMLLFLITTFREYAFTPVFFMSVAIWLWTFKKNNGTAMITMFTILSGLLSLVSLFKESLGTVTMLFFDRFLLIGGQVTGVYYDFFSTHKPGYYGTSFGQLFFPQTYATDIGIVIGNAYYQAGSSTTATNFPAHFWADAYGNLLWPGMVVAQIIAMALFWVVDSAYVKIDKNAAVVMGVMMALSISTEGLQTSLITGGLIPMIFVGLMGSRALRHVPDQKGRHATAQVQGHTQEAPTT
jgi:hypothetical protein